MNEFAKRFMQCLEDSGLKKIEFARLMNLSPSTITAICNGRIKSLNSQRIYKAAAILNVSPRWLATGKGVATIGAIDEDIVHLSDYPERLVNVFQIMKNLSEDKLSWLEMAARLVDSMGENASSIDKVYSQLLLPDMQKTVSPKIVKRVVSG